MLSRECPIRRGKTDCYGFTNHQNSWNCIIKQVSFKKKTIDPQPVSSKDFWKQLTKTYNVGEAQRIELRQKYDQYFTRAEVFTCRVWWYHDHA